MKRAWDSGYRGVCYSSLRQYERAIEDYDQAIDLEPTAARYSDRGDSYMHLRQHLRAIEDYDKALELDPNDEAVLANRQTLLDYRGYR